ncbi:MAG TPA: class C beta-lactamase [Lichenihabitans sp.]|jgi:beta-lactamase class C|nr:class C beta-lactamase [Lichenihabitans sp.]
MQATKGGIVGLTATILCITCMNPATGQTVDEPQSRIRRAVDEAIRPLMAKDNIPGLAVGLTVAGKPYVFDYGVASKQTRRPVSRGTLFELGSITKTFTATLASWAQAGSRLSLSDPTGRYLPNLQGSAFGEVTLLELGTHTPGGLPLQVPDGIRTEDQMMRYFQAWRPAYPPGTYRTYSNPGVGALGLITATSMGQDFTALMEQRLFPALGLANSFIDVPASRMGDYAQGYTKDGAPIRMAPGVFSAEAYGIKTTAADTLRFLDANLGLIALDETLQRAITDTHTGYVQAGPMTQDLIWEQYPYPVALQALLDGNSPAMALNATPVTEMKPPQKPQANVWINKTGSTNGFGAYVAFIPEKRLGIVILANRNFPIEDRVAAAFKILTSLSDSE